MDVKDPLMAAFPVAKRLWKAIIKNRRFVELSEVADILEEVGLKKACFGDGLLLFRNRDVIALLVPRNGMIIIDFISATGELSDALELVAYLDKEIECYVIEILPASEFEEENIGVEPVIIDANTFELKSYPVLGEFEERKNLILHVDRETFDLWKESGKLSICPVCGGRLKWKGERAICTDCGVEVVVDEER
ncbi:zinc ribbon domain-containing protein [Pyrococcus abyssi]|uniref:Uncharacterized protein n=1 Tax=Pyrococcus abyssi (strain GE5 / Orsay) TaxID=272844 RepID=Q9V2A1_PYRAB|nr:zinc ribbon domain-containing protein [Pyrococcus abyssi]CAB49097.1 Hypothetical protein PAB0116 [Pyrococcus abyssi GE5]CCE69549.1 TPA: hypothetical protein PAB0116 [Pyrococcus abyssi GE5]